MSRAIFLVVLFFLAFVVLTQVGWLSNNFYGVQLGVLPSGAGSAVFLGTAAVLLVLTVLKLWRWWKK